MSPTSLCLAMEAGSPAECYLDLKLLWGGSGESVSDPTPRGRERRWPEQRKGWGPPTGAQGGEGGGWG